MEILHAITRALRHDILDSYELELGVWGGRGVEKKMAIIVLA